jgi:hypothetical protein
MTVLFGKNRSTILKITLAGVFSYARKFHSKSKQRKRLQKNISIYQEMSTMDKVKKRKAFDYKKKLKYVKLIKDNVESRESLGTQLELNPQVIGRWEKNYENIKTKVSESPSMLKMKKFRAPVQER